MAITGDINSKTNLIILAASKWIQYVIHSIVDDPHDGTRASRGLQEFRADWLARYGSLKDLNIITATKYEEYLEAPQEQPDRYPFCGFVMEQVIRNPDEDGEELFIGELGCIIGVRGETFPISMLEIHEIHKAINSLLYLNKSLGDVTGLGGVIDKIRYDNFQSPTYDKIEMRNPHVGIQFNYQIWFREAMYE